MSQCLFEQCNKNKREKPKFFKLLQKQDTFSLWMNRLKVKYEDEQLCKNCLVCSDHFRGLMKNCNLKELPSDVLLNYVDAANADSFNKDLSTHDSLTLAHSFQRIGCNTDSICLTDGKAKMNAQNSFFSVPSRKCGDRSVRLLPRKLLFEDDEINDDASPNQTNGQQSSTNKRKKLSNENERNFKRPKCKVTDDGSSNLNSIKSTGNEIEIFNEDQMDKSNLSHRNMFSDNQISQQSASEQGNRTNQTSRIKLTPFRQFSNEKIKKASSFATYADVHAEPTSLLKFQDEIRKTATDVRNVSKRFREETALCTSKNKRTFTDR